MALIKSCLASGEAINHYHTSKTESYNGYSGVITVDLSSTDIETIDAIGIRVTTGSYNWTMCEITKEDNTKLSATAPGEKSGSITYSYSSKILTVNVSSLQTSTTSITLDINITY